MLRKKKDNSEYEIDRELTWKFAIEKNAEYQEKIEQLEEENKKLNIKVASLEWEIKWLNYTIEKLKEENQTLELWLDRKEKLNNGYREDVDYWHHRCMVAERWWEDED